LVGQPVSALIVTTPQEIAIADVRRSVTFCRLTNLPILGIVENMSGFACPNCHEHIAIFGTNGGKRLADEMGLMFLQRIPIDPRIMAAGDAGALFVRQYPDSPAAAAFKSIVTTVLADAPPASACLSNHSQPQEKIMKIAVPMADGKLCMHFGHCEQFALIDVDETSKRTHAIVYVTPPPHEPGLLPRWLQEQGANVIIAGGMGQRAQGLFAQNGIKVVVGVAMDDPQTVVSAYLSGTLKTGVNTCDH